MFIVFEGIDGSGKTTQADLLAKHLRSEGKEVLLTREPGGTDLAEKLRSIILSDHYSLDSYTQLLLVLAARRNHYYRMILPATQQKKIVICDRFFYSTIVYQGCGFGVDQEFIKKAHKDFGCLINPDFTILLDIDYQETTKKGDDRFEKMDTEFFSTLVKGYRSLAQKHPDIKLLKRQGKDQNQVHQQVLAELKLA